MPDKLRARLSVVSTIIAVTIVSLLLPAIAFAHNVSKRDASFVQSNNGTAIGPFLYLGAKHMLTGYDHIMFLIGVIFFLYRLKDIVTYVSLFTLGHSTTLLLGVFTGVHAPVITGVFVPEPARYKVDSREIKLDVGQGMEIKYHMQQGAGMVYSWTASKNIQFEFHGEPDVKPAGAAADYFESYEKNDVDGKSQSNGTFTAPSTGIEGWFWDNESEGPVTIKLVTAGFYDYILQNKDDVKTRLQPSDPQ